MVFGYIMTLLLRCTILCILSCMVNLNTHATGNLLGKYVSKWNVLLYLQRIINKKTPHIIINCSHKYYIYIYMVTIMFVPLISYDKYHATPQTCLLFLC